MNRGPSSSFLDTEFRETGPCRIRVPATSANLGPGFDTLGLAVPFYNYFEARAAKSLSVSVLPSTTVDLSHMPCDPERNLMARSYRRYFDAMGYRFIPAHLGIEAHIPTSRGLGSSSTAIVAGLFLANMMQGLPLTRRELLPMAVELEGHPDNVAPALLGGVCYCTSDSQEHAPEAFGGIEKLVWPEDWGLLFVIPPMPLSTKKARAVLPKSYSDADLDAHQQSVLEWVRALKAQDTTAFSKALCSDVMHEPYRKPLIPEWPVIEHTLAEEPILGVVLSGAGSTLLVMTPNSETTQRSLAKLEASPELAHCRFLVQTVTPKGVVQV
jgi:homoserine kinase